MGMTETSTTHKVGDEIEISGTVVTITQGFKAGRFGWWAEAAEVGSQGSYPSIEAAIENAFKALNGPRCPVCGDPATMIGSIRRTCAAHFED